MIVFSNASGNVIYTSPEAVYQGSSLSGTVYFLAPLGQQCSVTVSFELPDGSIIGPYVMTPSASITGVQDSGGDTYNSWIWSVSDNAVTSIAGTVVTQFTVYLPNGTGQNLKTLTTATTQFIVEQGVIPAMPAVPDTDTWETVLQTYNALAERVLRLENEVTNKVLVDFTVNSVTGEGVKYYSDGTTANVQFPVGSLPTFQGQNIVILDFNEESFTQEQDGSYSLAFGSTQTGFDSNNFLSILDKNDTATYKVDLETVSAEREGRRQLADSFFKGSDGSIYLSNVLEPFAGRLILLGGVIVSGQFVMSVVVDGRNITVTNADGSEIVYTLPQFITLSEGYQVFATIENLNETNLMVNNLSQQVNSIAVPTKVSELENDSNYATTSDVNNKFSEVPQYSISETETQEGFLKSYVLLKDGVQAGTTINIPKDLVVESGSVETVIEPNIPYEGAVVGDKYINLVLNDSSSSSIYIPVKELVDIYTAGQGININDNNEISVRINSQQSNGLSANENGLSLALVTNSTAGAMSAENLITLGNCVLVVSQTLTDTQKNQVKNNLSIPLKIVVGVKVEDTIQTIIYSDGTSEQLELPDGESGLLQKNALKIINFNASEFVDGSLAYSPTDTGYGNAEYVVSVEKLNDDGSYSQTADSVNKLSNGGFIFSNVITPFSGRFILLKGVSTSGTALINKSEITATILPNVFYKWGEVDSLTISFEEETPNILNEYMFEFESGDTATILTVPNTVKWINEPSIEPNSIYQVSIVNNIGVIGGIFK